MLFNTNVCGDPRSFFYYKGDFYIDGTEIMLKEEYRNKHLWNGQKLWKYARYDHQIVYNGKISYFFCQSKTDWLSLYEMGLDRNVKFDYAPYFVVDSFDMENLIEEFTRPIKLTRYETEAIINATKEKKSYFQNERVLVLWIVYIIAMIGSLIFKQFYFLWIALSFVFFKIRKGMIE